MSHARPKWIACYAKILQSVFNVLLKEGFSANIYHRPFTNVTAVSFSVIRCLSFAEEKRSLQKLLFFCRLNHTWQMLKPAGSKTELSSSLSPLAKLFQGRCSYDIVYLSNISAFHCTCRCKKATQTICTSGQENS